MRTLVIFLLVVSLVQKPAVRTTVTFEEVPAATSKITWTHDNGHSPERQLPETVGAGCQSRA